MRGATCISRGKIPAWMVLKVRRFIKTTSIENRPFIAKIRNINKQTRNINDKIFKYTNSIEINEAKI